MKHKEISWINWAKFVCLLFVYIDNSIIYSKTSIPLLTSLYDPFFVNIFFFMSGYLLFRKQLSNKAIIVSRSDFTRHDGGGVALLRSIINRIALPTVFFAIIIYFPKKFVRGEDFSIMSFLKETVLGGSMWFTCALAVAELLILLMLCSRKKNLTFYIAISTILTILAVIIKNSGFTVLSSDTLPWFYKSGMIATLFLSLGGVYNRFEVQIDKVIGHYYYIIIFILVYISVIVFAPDLAIISLQDSTITISGLIVALGSIYIVIYLTKLLHSNMIINHLGRISLGIYLPSGGIPNVIAVLAIRFGFPNIYLNVGFVSLISFAIGIVVVHILNYICPFVFDFSRLVKTKQLKEQNQQDIKHSKYN